jgi:hypothetical protein
MNKCTSTTIPTGDARNGSVSVNPTVTTTYRVTCTGDYGTRSAETLVTVGAAPSVLLTLTPGTITRGGSATLSWQSGNSTSCLGTNFLTLGRTTGTVTVSPTASTVYTVTCTNATLATARATKTLTVNAAPPATTTPPTVYACSDGKDNDTDGKTDYPADPGCTTANDTDEYNAPVIPTPTATLTATPRTITAGQTSTLTWTSTNTTSCTGTGFTTSGATNGSVTVSPTRTTSYTLTCTGAGGTVTRYAAVTVQAAPDTTIPAPTLSSAPLSGSQVYLFWVFTGGTSASYTIERCAGATCTNFTSVGTDTASPYLDSGLTKGTTYRYRVRTTGGGISNVVTAVTPNY